MVCFKERYKTLTVIFSAFNFDPYVRSEQSIPRENVCSVHAYVYTCEHSTYSLTLTCHSRSNEMLRTRKHQWNCPSGTLWYTATGR